MGSSYVKGWTGTDVRVAQRDAIYLEIIKNKHWVIPIKNQAEMVYSNQFKLRFEKPQPAYVINPIFGTCLVWGRSVIYDNMTFKQKVYYLVTFVKAVDAVLGNEYQVIPGKYYKVPATITLRDGSEVDYIIILKCIISKMTPTDSSDHGVALVDVTFGTNVLRQTMNEFMRIMNQSPPGPDSAFYREAYSAFCHTHPEYVSLNRLGSEIIVSEEASRYLISETSRQYLETPSSSTEAQTSEESSTIGAAVSIQKTEFSMRTMSHPTWYAFNPTLMREFELSFSDSTASTLDHQDPRHVRIDQSRREMIFNPNHPTVLPPSHISHLNNLINY